MTDNNLGLSSSYLDVLGRLAALSNLSRQTAAYDVGDTVAKCLVEEPIDDRIDGAVSVTEPQRKRQQQRVAGVIADVRDERDDVVGKPADDEHRNDRHQ